MIISRARTPIYNAASSVYDETIRRLLKGTVNPVMFLWLLAAFAAFFIKGLCGFANTLVFTAILSFGPPNASISPVDVLLGYPANLILTWKNRRSLDPKIVLPLAGLVLAGSIPGALMLKNVDAGAIKLVFGFAVIALGAEMLTREFRKKRDRASGLAMAIIGVFAGVMCGLFGVGRCWRPMSAA